MPKSATDKRHFIIAAALIAISTVVLEFLFKAALPLGVKGSIEALTIDALIGWHFTIIAFLFSLVVVFMLYAIVIFRKRDGDESEGAHFEGNTTLEIAWTVLPLIAVVVFAFYGITALAKVTEGGETLTVKANGFQWSWSFEYAEGFVSPELVLPKDERVLVELHAKDVLHSFWIPEMRVKQDLVPGQPTHIRFTPIVTGDFKVRCAELCGLSHWSMESPVRVLEKAEYDAWVKEQVAAMDSAVAQAPGN